MILLASTALLLGIALIIMDRMAKALPATKSWIALPCSAPVILMITVLGFS